jgi:Ku protein
MPALGHVYWRGFLRLQLVSINVDIYSAAESAAEIQFNQIHKPSGKRIKYQKVVPGIGPIENADIVKGYQVEPDVYVTMEPEEIEAIRLESKKTIDMVQFVDAEQIDPRYYERPYYIVPKDEVASEGYLVIREALQKAGKVGLGQLTMQGREHLGVIAFNALQALWCACEMKPPCSQVAVEQIYRKGSGRHGKTMHFIIRHADNTPPLPKNIGSPTGNDEIGNRNKTFYEIV